MFDALEIIGTALGLLYLYYEYKASIWLWVVGIAMPLVYIFVYYRSGFYADMGINIYYVGAGVYGWWAWLRTKKSGDGVELPISRTPKKYYLPLSAAFVVFFAILSAILINFTDSTVPYGDSFTTALSIVALWMLTRKYAEQWLMWVAVDAVCAWLYLSKGLYPTSALYALYTVIAVAGYFKWLKMADDKATE